MKKLIFALALSTAALTSYAVFADEPVSSDDARAPSTGPMNDPNTIHETRDTVHRTQSSTVRRTTTKKKRTAPIDQPANNESDHGNVNGSSPAGAASNPGGAPGPAGAGAP